MNGFTRLRFESIMYYHDHALAFELWVWVATKAVEGPYVSDQDGVFLDQFRNLTASQPFQSIIMNNEWLGKVEVGLWAVKRSPQRALDRGWG